jgi:ADP-heptose:LPS heptosyltransferase
MIRGYASRSKVKVAILRAIDRLMVHTVGAPSGTLDGLSPRRILVSNFAHIGDVVLATAVIAPLKQRFPEAKIGFLVGSWAAPVLSQHPDIDRIHVFDHWAFQRGSQSRLGRLRRALATLRQAKHEIQSLSYDLGIDLYWNFQNGIPFLRWLGIPVIAGYASGGLGPLATVAVTPDGGREHALDRHAKVLSAIGLPSRTLMNLSPSLPPVTVGGHKILADRLGERWQNTLPYVVVHASGSVNSWTRDGWADLIRTLVADGKRVVLTGLGAPEAARSRDLASLSPECVSVADILSWKEFVAVIASSDAVVAVDTAAAHVAGALGRPTVVIMPGIWSYLWKPAGSNVRCITAPVPCSPCHRNRGCDLMRCVLDVTPEQVRRELEVAMGERERPGHSCAFPNRGS